MAPMPEPADLGRRLFEFLETMAENSCKFHVVISGAGLGGLGAAVALARKGHRVTVLEAAHALSEIGAGIQIPPNSSRVLAQYGLREKLLEKVVWPQHFTFRRYATGELLGHTPLNPHLTEKYGSPYWLIHRADFQSILFDAAVALGVDVRLGCSVKSVDASGPSVKLVTGETVAGDVVIGADGIRSKAREAVVGEKNVEPNASANCSYRATVPAEIMSADPDIAHLMTDINANCWIGPDHHIMAYPIRQGAMYNLVLSHPGGVAAAGRWNEPGNLEEMLDHYKDFDPVIRKVLSKVQSCLNWKIADLPNLPTWVSDNGRIALLGDAAHAMTPLLAQGAAQAIEDGACFAECLSRARSTADLPTLLRAYESIRKPRAERVQKGARDTGNVWHLPDGPEQKERDRAFAVMGKEVRDKESDAALDRVNPNSMSSKNFQPWLFGRDEIAWTNEKLDEMNLFKRRGT